MSADSERDVTASPTRRRRVPNRRGHGDRLRTELVRAASELLERLDSQEALSLRAVARQANVAPQSVYLHFSDRKALISAVFEARFADLLTELTAAAAGVTEPLARLRAICHTYCGYAIRHPGHYWVLFGTAGTPGWQPHELHGMEALTVLTDALRACTTGKEGEDVEDAAPAHAAICLWAALHGLVTLRRDRPSFPWPDLEDLIDALLQAHTALPNKGSRSERYPRRGGWGARRGEGSGGLELFARLGFVARGIAYVVIGVIGVMLALGIAKHEPDRAGAIEAIATKPFGYLLLDPGDRIRRTRLPV